MAIHVFQSNSQIQQIQSVLPQRFSSAGRVSCASNSCASKGLQGVRGLQKEQGLQVL